MSVLKQLVEYVVNSGAFLLPEDPQRPGEHDWKAVPLVKMERTIIIGPAMIRKQFPDQITAWGQRIPKDQCALVYGTAVSFASDVPNKRAYLVRAMRDSEGHIIAVPLALFAHGPRGWFLSSQVAPPRFGVEQAQTNAAAAATVRQQPLDGQTLGIILSWLNSEVGAVPAAAGAVVDATPVSLLDET